MLARQSHNFYVQGDPSNPRCDPTFRKRIMAALRENEGTAVHLEPIVGGDPTTIHEAIKVLRRVGWQIDGQRGCAGYTLTDIDPPEGWLRLVESIRKDEKQSGPFFPRKAEPIAAGQVAWC